MAKNTLWCEKYRPHDIDHLLLTHDFKEKCVSWINEKDIPHVLFTGDPGVGKTSLAFILADAVAPEDTLFVNASKETGIDTIRTKVTNFAMSVSFADTKVIIMDEADRISPNGQDALKVILEEYADFVRFIFTANNPDRIIGPLKSRCQAFAFTKLSKKQVMIMLAKVLVEEKVKATPEQLELIIESCEGDLRKAINTAQFSTINGKLNTSKEMLSSSDYKFAVLKLLNDRNITGIRQLIADEGIKEFTPLYKFLFDNSKDISVGKSYVETMLTMSEYLYRDAVISDKEINFSACMLNLVK